MGFLSTWQIWHKNDAIANKPWKSLERIKNSSTKNAASCKKEREMYNKRVIYFAQTLVMEQPLHNRLSPIESNYETVVVMAYYKFGY